MADDKNILESSYGKVSLPSISNESVCDFLLEKAEENVKAGKLQWMTNSISGESITFADVKPMTLKVSSFFRKRGMQKGDVALYLTTDVTRIYPIMLGIWRNAGLLYSSYPEDTEAMLLLRIQESKAKWIFCDPVSTRQCLGAAKKTDWPVEVFVFGKHEECTSVDEIFKDDGSKCTAYSNTELDDRLLILCTSGTTGLSKGAVYTNRTILAFCLGTDAIPWNQKPALYLLRATHVLGVIFPIRNINGAVSAVMMHEITLENAFKAVDKYKPYLAFGFPTYLTGLATSPDANKYDISSLEIMCTGGLVIPAKVYETLLTIPNVRAVMNGFGMTECGAISTTVDLSWPNEIRAIPNIPPLTVGKLYPNTSLKVIDLDTGKLLGPSQKGELAIKSPVMCTGYWNRPEETAKTFQNGWLRTGDLGYYDEDGFVFITDRLKETFKYFNNHISPSDLEEVLVQHPAVAEASVFGIKDPNGGDHIPRAVVTLKTGMSAQADNIREFVDEKVASYKKLRGGVFIVPALPRGKTGKVVRSLVATMQLDSN